MTSTSIEAATVPATNNTASPTTSLTAPTPVARPNERIIRPYGKYATLIKNEQTQEVFLRHTFPKSDPHSYWRALRAVEATKISSRHLNAAMPLLASKHRNGDVDVEVEFADAGSLAMYIKLIHEKFDELHKSIKAAQEAKDETKVNMLKAELHEAKLHQIQMAKSVGRQLLEYCFYLDTVLDRTHKNLNPETVLFRRDGCVKTTFFNYLDKNYIKANRFHFIDFNAYVAPELTTTGLYSTTTKLSGGSSSTAVPPAASTTGSSSPPASPSPSSADAKAGVYKELNGLIDTIHALFKEATQRSVDVAAQERINNPTVKSDIWSVGAILYSIMTAINFMPNWDYREPEYTPTTSPQSSEQANQTEVIVNNHSSKTETVISSDKTITTSTSNSSNSGAAAAAAAATSSQSPQSKAAVDHEKEQKMQVVKFTSFLEFVKYATIEQWTETFGNDPFLTYIARRCLTINAAERATISELNAFVFLSGGFVLADETQPYRNLDDRLRLKPIKCGKLFEKFAAPDANGRKYELKHNFGQVWDAFSTDCSCLSRGTTHDKESARMALEKEDAQNKEKSDKAGSSAPATGFSEGPSEVLAKNDPSSNTSYKVAIDSSSSPPATAGTSSAPAAATAPSTTASPNPATTPKPAPGSIGSSSSGGDPLNEENHGEGILREMKPFNETRFGKIYRQRYCHDESITDEMILSKTDFAADDPIDPDMCILFPKNGDEQQRHVKAWVASTGIGKSDSVRDVSVFLQLESRMFRRRRNMGSDSTVAIEKRRRELTRGRQIVAWIALGRATAYFREGYTKP